METIFGGVSCCYETPDEISNPVIDKTCYIQEYINYNQLFLNRTNNRTKKNINIC